MTSECGLNNAAVAVLKKKKKKQAKTHLTVNWWNSFFFSQPFWRLQSVTDSTPFELWLLEERSCRFSSQKHNQVICQDDNECNHFWSDKHWSVLLYCAWVCNLCNARSESTQEWGSKAFASINQTHCNNPNCRCGSLRLLHLLGLPDFTTSHVPVSVKSC